MKIQINFDLLSKIKEANTGMSLKRSACKMLVGTACTTALAFPYIMNDASNGEDFGMNFLMILLAQTIYTINSNKLFADKYKEIASISSNLSLTSTSHSSAKFITLSDNPKFLYALIFNSSIIFSLIYIIYIILYFN